LIVRKKSLNNTTKDSPQLKSLARF
jgi:hypothetical protein